MSLSAALILLLSASAPSAIEQEIDRRLSPGFNPCIDAASGVTVSTMSCIGLEIDRQHEALNRTFRGIISKLPRGAGNRLRASQRAWVRARDRRCWHKGPGTLEVVIAKHCILNETIRRTIWLERYDSGTATLADLNR